MTGKDHHYSATLRWTGNRGTGTSGYRDYDRSYTLSANGKVDLDGSSDPTFRGDAAKWNPEEMLLSALSSCHMLSYLHQCADAGITVLEYTDDMSGTMELDRDGAGRFTGVTLRPRVLLADTADLKLAESLHHIAHEKCFIANSVNFPVRCEAVVLPQMFSVALGKRALCMSKRRTAASQDSQGSVEFLSRELEPHFGTASVISKV